MSARRCGTEALSHQKLRVAGQTSSPIKGVNLVTPAYGRRSPPPLRLGFVNTGRGDRSYQIGIMNDMYDYASGIQVGLGNVAGHGSRSTQIGLINIAGGRIADLGVRPSLRKAGALSHVVQFGICCYASKCTALQLGLVTLRGEGRWYQRMSPLLGFSCSR